MDDQTAPVEAGETSADGPDGTTSVAPAAPRSERISVGAGDENVAKIQLAARWAEQFARPGDDSLDSMLRRFKRAYAYIDAVSKLIEPDDA
ncbi:MAG: hypothetical protein IT305_14790 [Chloroflexi bacterium]|nr:hypothetical protein [Chloroflexota bacterium]